MSGLFKSVKSAHYSLLCVCVKGGGVKSGGGVASSAHSFHGCLPGQVGRGGEVVFLNRRRGNKSK